MVDKVDIFDAVDRVDTFQIVDTGDNADIVDTVDTLDTVDIVDTVETVDITANFDTVDIVDKFDIVDTIDIVDILNIPDTHFDTLDVTVTLSRQSETIIVMDSEVLRKFEKCYFLHQWDLRDASASKKGFCCMVLQIDKKGRSGNH